MFSFTRSRSRLRIKKIPRAAQKQSVQNPACNPGWLTCRVCWARRSGCRRKCRSAGWSPSAGFENWIMPTLCLQLTRKKINTPVQSGYEDFQQLIHIRLGSVADPIFDEEIGSNQFFLKPKIVIKSSRSGYYWCMKAPCCMKCFKCFKWCFCAT